MRVAIVGAGLVGCKRASAAADCTIVAVADKEIARAEKLAAGTGAWASTDWRAVLNAELDAVLICTSHDALAAIAQAAVEKGLHVLVEKPAGRHAAEIAPLVSAARRTGLIIKVGYNHRFHPAISRAKQLVDSGALGPILYLRGRYGHGGRPGMETEWRCQPQLSGGGELIDQGSHLIDLARWFLGDLVLEYGSARAHHWNIPVDDNCFLALRGVNGALAWLHASWSEWKNLFCFEIAGREGKLVIDGLGGSYGTERLTHYRLLPQMGPPETTIWEYPFPDVSWRNEFADFCAAIQEGRRACGDIEDAYHVMRIVDEVYGR
jgi:predicted dehydrogenase